MERDLMQQLTSWKRRKGRKPLIIRGARQVGKTWLMKEFGKNEFRQTAYINFESSKRLKEIFLYDYDIQRILTAVKIETGVTIEPESTLIIFDEIQEAEGALTALKYFNETAPDHYVIAAGSLLGLALHQKTSFPVGKVEFLDLYPLSFIEFMLALDQQSLVNLLRERDWPMIKSFREKYIQLLRYYYFIGGMPEAVVSFAGNKDFSDVRAIQNRLLQTYEFDFSKYPPGQLVPRIRMLWNSILAQLARENRKFIFGAIKAGSRAKDYEMALSWLIDCGLVHKISRISKPALPLKAYEDPSAFKLFHLDVGLLGTIGNLDVTTILEGNTLFQEFKGALTEQFVLQQLLTLNVPDIFYWSADKSTAEIDFLVQVAGQAIPIEVKAEENLQAKSLRFFCQKYKPAMAVRTSMSDFRKEEWMINLPLYAISEFPGMDW